MAWVPSWLACGCGRFDAAVALLFSSCTDDTNSSSRTLPSPRLRKHVEPYSARRHSPRSGSCIGAKYAATTCGAVTLCR
ncbi:hypothetical protein MTO96_040932, partial [Rhipicephalus appendiculatus]